jgi:hypothetical protein
LSGVGAMYGLAKMAGARVEADSTSSDYGKIIFGTHSIDVLGGIGQMVTLMSQIGQHTKTSVSGRKVDLADPKFGQQGIQGLLGQNVLYKLAPVPSLALELYTGKDAIGRPVLPIETVIGAVTPIPLQDVGQDVTRAALNIKANKKKAWIEQDGTTALGRLGELTPEQIFKTAADLGIPKASVIYVLNILGMSHQDIPSRKSE